MIVGTKTMLAGSPGFQPPEQLRNDSLDVPSDVYALGAVLLVLFGETPVWPALSPFQIMYKVAVCNQRSNTGHLLPQIRDVSHLLCGSVLTTLSQSCTSGYFERELDLGYNTIFVQLCLLQQPVDLTIYSQLICTPWLCNCTVISVCVIR